MIPLMFLQSIQNIELGSKGPSYVGGSPSPLCVSLSSLSKEIGFPDSFHDGWIKAMTIIKQLGLNQAELALTSAILYEQITKSIIKKSGVRIFHFSFN